MDNSDLQRVLANCNEAHVVYLPSLRTRLTHVLGRLGLANSSKLERESFAKPEQLESITSTLAACLFELEELEEDAHKGVELWNTMRPAPRAVGS